MSNRVRASAFVLTILLGLAPSVASAQFATTRVVSGSLGGCEDPVVSYGSTDRVSIGFSSGGEVYHTNSGSQFATLENVSNSPAESGQVGQAQGALFLVHLAYREAGEIILVNNAGGVFGSPQALTTDGFDDRRPRPSVGGGGALAVVWERTGPGGAPQILTWRPSIGASVIAEGASPRIAIRDTGEAIVAYLRGGQSYYRVATAGSVGPEELLVFQAGSHDALSLAIDPSDTVHAVVRVGSDLYHTQDGGIGNFAAADLVAAGADGAIDIGAGGVDRVAVAYETGAAIECLTSTGGGWDPLALPGSTIGASPNVVVDPHGFVHLAFERAGQIRYTNDAPTPEAAFTALPTGGVLPLTVMFENQSTGVIASVLWDFGDGTTSTAFSPTHQYVAPGPFTVTLTVNGPSGSDTLVQPGAISTTLPPNVLRIPHIPSFAGATVAHPILANHQDDLQGFQIAFLYDEGRVIMDNVDFTGSATSSIAPPEFVFFETNPGGPNSEAIIAVVLDYVEPFDGRVIPAGNNHILASVRYEIDFPQADTSPILFRLSDGLGTPPVDNVFAIQGGLAVRPYLVNGSVSITALPQIIFKRGDANFDQVINIGDPVFLLAYFFSDGPDPVCPDSSDVNDDGALDLGDAIFGLTFLFNDGAAPPYPFPGFGLDPTADGLGPCVP